MHYDFRRNGVLLASLELATHQAVVAELVRLGADTAVPTNMPPDYAPPEADHRQLGLVFPQESVPCTAPLT